MKLLMSLLLVAVTACASIDPMLTEPIQSAKPLTAPSMRTYTPEGYEVDWWIFEEFDSSCTVEYAILGLNKEQLGKGVIPCQMMVMFFHAIQPRVK